MTNTITTEKRPIRMRKRPDLKFEPQTQQERIWWVVKDPLSLKYFRLREEQYAALTMLNGETSVSEIRESLASRFPSIAITNAQLHALFRMFHQSGMVLSDSTGQGAQLLHRRDTQERRKWLIRLMSVLWIKLPGVDPDRCLSLAHRKLRWFYSPVCIGMCLALIAVASMLVTLRFDDFQSRLPKFQEFFTAGNMIWLMASLAVAKILHELGHGLTCKHFGSECHQIGLMFLVFTPCLYCDTSDSWMLRSKWKRAAIGAAGIYVELILAAICTLIWWNTKPGMLHYLCLSTMTVCSVSTLVFNANPLLRYDGYYILSDLIEVPNLSRRARSYLTSVLQKWILGITPTGPSAVPIRHSGLFIAYAIAAPIYRLLVVVVILWFLSELFEPYGLKSVGYVLIGVCLLGTILVPLWQFIGFVKTPGRLDRMKKPRLLITAVLISGIIAAGICVPIPHYVTAAVVIQPRNAERIYVSVPGELSRIDVQNGDVIDAGQSLVSLRNPDIEFEIARLTGRTQRLQTQLKTLKRQESDDRTAMQRIPQVEESLAALQERIARLQADESRLALASSIAGTVFPPPETPHRTSAGELAQLSGTPLDDANQGAWLKTGTLLCMIGAPQEMNAILVIDQSDIDIVKPEQAVRVRLTEFPNDTLHGQISAIATDRMQAIPQEVTVKLGGTVTTESSATGVEQATNACYEARVPLGDVAGLISGLRGQARIHVGSQPLGITLWKYIMTTIEFG